MSEPQEIPAVVKKYFPNGRPESLKRLFPNGPPDKEFFEGWEPGKLPPKFKELFKDGVPEDLKVFKDGIPEDFQKFLDERAAQILDKFFILLCQLYEEVCDFMVLTMINLF
ncbi:hypothetical protein H8356DRAFT_1010812 [Neocallimastix lanati (nom. inval.)]|nr:hypothetical protein H8356DRAFT_1010812 [Neocallimastix sp. JGI-2020a]